MAAFASETFSFDTSTLTRDRTARAGVFQVAGNLRWGKNSSGDSVPSSYVSMGVFNTQFKNQTIESVHFPGGNFFGATGADVAQGVRVHFVYSHENNGIAFIAAGATTLPSVAGWHFDGTTELASQIFAATPSLSNTAPTVGLITRVIMIGY